MTDKELKRLSRAELLELMLFLRKELDSVRSENDQLKKRLDEKEAEMTAASAEISAVLHGVKLLCKEQGIELDEPEKLVKDDSLTQADPVDNDGGAQQ